MNQETKHTSTSSVQACQNCKQNFVIEPEDFAFYEKIKVPAPTFCPECRMVRRMLWRNERALYKRKCDATGKDIISIYSQDKPLKVYDQKYWWSDNWDPMEYGRDYDLSQPFFKQLKSLFNEFPRISLENDNIDTLINCNYCNDSWDAKNCYLCVTVGEKAENLMYCDVGISSRDSVDSTWLVRSENCYRCIDCYDSYKVFFGQNIDKCIDSVFLFDCKNCQNCFGCVGLRNKQYNIFNKQYIKEEYEKKLKEFDFRSYKIILEAQGLFKKIKFDFPHKYALLTNCQNVFGNNVRHSKNCFNCFDIESGIENSKYIVYAGLGLKDSYDAYNVGTNASLFYDSISCGFNCSKILFSNFVWHNNFDVYYSQFCKNSSNLFACIGLRNKQYCILNKQYTKEEYEQLVPKIIEHMNNMPYIDKKGRIYKYGEFFPPELSPFSYNETIAQEYFPLTKEQAIQQGYSWKDPEERNIKPTITSDQLPDHIKDVSDTITKEIIECAHKGECNEQCTTAFKIIPQELEFYRKMNLPLPRLCPNCRHYQRLKQRNPLKLWHRQCQCQGQTGNNSNNPNIYQNTITHTHGTEPCPNEFETTYSPDRKEIVYCERCYQQEVV